ncbi:MAG TPA: hypothetical protein VK580_10870 [Steroidobacteraceae bacterium]|nr:hypothetical protein [Steroidobacteraceae bacterium]
MADSKPKPVMVNIAWQVDQMLREIGLTRDIVRSIAVAAASGRADALAVDPSGTPGTLSYIYGVRKTRLLLIPLGWQVSRHGHIESTVNHKLGIQLCFQNVDRACGDAEPQAISAKGSSARELIRSGQMDLFDTGEKSAVQHGHAPTVWLICVSADNDSIRAEVSCPKVFEGDQFDGFAPRLFCIDESTGPKPTRRDDTDDDGDLDLDIPVSKK